MNSLLLEIGTEEIPASYIQPALEALAGNLSRKLADARIKYGAVHTYGTPRRLVVTMDDVADRQQARTEELLGPPEQIAFDPNGQPTVPAHKFAEKTGVPVERLKVRKTDKGSYLYATISDRGMSTKAFLKQMLPEVILATPFPKTMRWSDLSISFARPIQSIVALLGKAVVPFTLGGRLKSGRQAWGHMFLNHKKIKIDRADGYLEAMRQAHVIVDIQTRREMVCDEVTDAAKKVGGHVLPDEELVDIVTNLVEIPIASAGKFDHAFLELPREILITAMRKHQKYFAVVDGDNRLMPCFVAVNNTRTKDMALVATGHERVLRARLSDAQFFYKADRQESMDSWAERLKGVLFQAQLGSMFAKVQRIQAMAAYLSEKEAPALRDQVIRAAQLSKADLVSQVVCEFPDLQGIMGRVYATAAGESTDVAAAIEEHYRPTHSGGQLPQTLTGALLAIADKLDTICGCFSVGLVPTGASDPYALRRQCIGIVQIALTHGFTFSLQKAIAFCLQHFTPADQVATQAAVYTFIQNRIAYMLAEEGLAKDVIAAVISVSVDNIPNVWQRAAALQRLKGMPDFEPLAVAFKRAVNILRKADRDADVRLDGTLFVDPAETALFEAFQEVQSQVAQQLSAGKLEQALRTIATLRMPVDRFFEDVMVMVDDLKLRRNRLELLKCIEGLFNQIADFSKIAT